MTATQLSKQKIWSFLPSPEPELLRKVSGEFRLSQLVSSILIRRDYTTSESIYAFLHPQLSNLRNPFLMRDMRKGVDLLKWAIFEQKRIVILGDYDVDGITATAMLMLFLKSCGCRNIDYFIPNRFDHGYGLTQASADVLLEMQPDLVVTVDNGITALREIQTLQQRGIRTLITDHHLADSSGSALFNGHPPQIPDGVVINPNRPDCDYPFKGISGCGVALKLLTALRKDLRDANFWTLEKPQPNLKAYLDLAALGTVADVVPLVDENRILAHCGIRCMNEQPRVGIQALSRLKNIRSVDTQTLAFQFAPLLNAAGRMYNAAIGVKLLLSDDFNEAEKIARQLDQANQERRETEARMLEIATEQARVLQHHHGMVLQSSQFHEGISGIVAARMVEQFYKPTIVCAKNGNYFKCSARSIPELHIKNILNQCAEQLEKFGGHAGAAGCTVHEQQFETFIEKYESTCKRFLTVDGQIQIPQPRLMLEEELTLDAIDWHLIDQLELLQPFGAANPTPLFSIPTPRQAFHTLKGKHLKWGTRGKDIIGWNLAGLFLNAQAMNRVPQKLAVLLGVNVFQGRRSIQLVIQDYQ